MAVVTFDKVAVLAAFFSSVLFIIGYSAVASWWHHPIGRAVAFLDCGLTITLTPSALHQMLGLDLTDLFFAWYYGVSLSLVALITLWRLVVIIRVQRADTPRLRAPAEPDPQDRVPME